MIPTIKSVMTPFPYSVTPQATLVEAEAMMREHGIRHLPVMTGGQLVGVVSDREIAWAHDPERDLGDPGAVVVERVMSVEPHTVSLHDPLENLLGEMADRVLDCAIVTKDGRVAGIVTTTDACRAFAKLLGRLGPGGGAAA